MFLKERTGSSPVSGTKLSGVVRQRKYMEVGSIIEANIVDINSNGEGIGKFENATVFIKMFKNAAYLDKVKIKITKIKKNYLTTDRKSVV